MKRTDREHAIRGDAGREGAPYVTPDGNALYFHARLAGNYHFDIYRAKKTATGFDPPEWLSINTSESEGRVAVSPDELTIYFYHDYEQSDPTAPAGIWMSTRTSVKDPFGQKISLRELNDIDGAYPLWISWDGCRLYYGDQDSQFNYWVYVAERTGVSR